MFSQQTKRKRSLRKAIKSIGMRLKVENEEKIRIIV